MAMKSLLVLLGVGLLHGFTGMALAQEGKKVEMKGTLRTGIVAIGGETTGTIIETKEGRFELDLGKDKELRQKAEKLNGKMVVATGTLVIKKGVEIKERRIVTVASLEEAKAN
jgi:hypothetical protein